MPNQGRNETQLNYHIRRAKELTQVRMPWEGVWRDLADFLEPTRLRLSDKFEGALKRSSIKDSTGTFALRTLASGMHSGVTSPSRPWFRLTTPDPELREFGPVKEYVDAVETRMRDVYNQSNVYNSFHTGYGDLGQFGQSCGLLLEDDKSVLRMMQFLHGQFWISRDENGRATTLYRKFMWNCQKIVERFGYANVSQPIKSAWDRAAYDQRYTVWHAVEPRLDRDPSMPDKRNKRWLSNYWEDATNTTGGGSNMLDESGFDYNPIISPPWELAGTDDYGTSPGHITLGDVKMLQLEQQRKMEAIDKKVRPPMTGPTSMRNNPNSLLPGSMTYSDDPQGKGYRPAMETNYPLNDLTADIRETRDRINQGFYADLFLMLSNMEGIQPRNVLEISERKEEKLLALGPVLENIYNNQLEPVIDGTYFILNRAGQLPPPPQELKGVNLKVEYTSTLAQAQKAVATGSIERLFGFVGQVASMAPEAIDKLDIDDAIDVYADFVGVPATVIKSDDDVAKVRSDRAAEMAKQQNAAAAPAMAGAAKDGADAAAVMAGTLQNPGGGSLLQNLGIGG